MTRSTPVSYHLDGDGPLYRQINRAIAQPILSGQAVPGTRLPSEHEFMELFNASRMTVNKALQMLADDGLVNRRRRSGTFVAPQVTEHSVLELRDIVDEVEAKGDRYGYQLLARNLENSDTLLSSKLGVQEYTEVLYLSCLHLSNDLPLLIEDRYINASAVPGCLDQSFSETPPGHWLLENIPWSRAEHVVTALNANARIAKILKIQKQTACLSIERTTWQDGIGLTYVTLTYPGDKHRLVGNFTPGQ